MGWIRQNPFLKTMSPRLEQLFYYNVHNHKPNFNESDNLKPRMSQCKYKENQSSKVNLNQVK